MFTKRQISEIRKHLDKAQNPLFFFDNDTDGMCAFLVLQRYCGKGKGIPMKSAPDDSNYLRKIEELNADYIFFLDKHGLSEIFLDEISKKNIPVVWIDHHKTDKKQIPKFVNYYNPVFSKKYKGEPTTYLCYEVSQKKTDMWIAIAGSISDRFTPEFYSDFKKEYPDLSYDSNDAYDIFYKSQIGKMARIFSFALKDRTTNVITMLKFLMEVKTPYEVLEETSKNKIMHNRFNHIYSKYKKLIAKAERDFDNSKKVLFFKYGGEMSISSDLSNELTYKFPDKIVVVAYVSGIKANISMRGKNVRQILMKVFEKVEGSGGGHDGAVGAQVRLENLEKFKELVEEISARSETYIT